MIFFFLKKGIPHTNPKCVKVRVLQKLNVVYVFHFRISCTTVCICCNSLSALPAAEISVAMTCGACNLFGT